MTTFLTSPRTGPSSPSLLDRWVAGCSPSASPRDKLVTAGLLTAAWFGFVVLAALLL